MPRFLPFVLGLSVASLAGCGVSTGLDLYDDAGFSGTDGSRRDAGGPRDAGPPVRCDSTDDCDDGLVCNGVETCSGGVCRAGMPPFCSDPVSCTRDTCVEGSGCTFVPDDSLCPAGMRCDTFADCVPGGGCGSDFECDDGDVCNGRERCAGGTCVAGLPMSCPVDPFPCTVESCDPVLGCTSIANSALCPPGQLCRADRGCVSVACMTDFDCNDGDPCNGSESCSPTTATCRPGRPLVCDDGNACTIDRCFPFMGCGSSTSVEICVDGIDNDCNGLFDCEDPVCFGRPECGFCTFDETSCRDGRDEDCDGLPDCADPSCAGRDGCPFCMPTERVERTCFDGRDNDCNGLIDCIDFNCASDPSCGGCIPVADREVVCFDGRDDDCDFFFDCEDMDCAILPECGGCMPTAPIEIACTDGRDDDCDGLFDCSDPDCSRTGSCGCVPSSPTETRCRDMLDDDCDGRLDCVDPDCATRPFCMSTCVPMAPRELGIDDCTDAIDNDCDGRTDCADPDCSPLGPMGECCNGRDDNGDSSIDEFTCRCFTDAACVGVGTYEQVCWENSYSLCAPDCRLYGGTTWCRRFLPDTPTCSSTTGECI